MNTISTLDPHVLNLLLWYGVLYLTAAAGIVIALYRVIGWYQDRKAPRRGARYYGRR